MCSWSSVSFVSNRYESYTEIESGESGIHDNTMYFIFGKGVASELCVDSESFVVSADKGVVLVPHKRIRVKRPPGSEILILRLTQSSLREYYELILNQKLHRGIQFESGVDLTKGPGAFLKRLVTNLLYEIQQDGVMTRHETIRNSYGELLQGALLQMPHHTASTSARTLGKEIAPGRVIRAEEYIRANLSKPITITKLLSVCGCSRTALYSCFNSSRGYTPMEFLTEQRLLKARQQLMQSVPEITISSIAYNCGFTHLGRFSQLYRKRFGELPSTTSRK